MIREEAVEYVRVSMDEQRTHTMLRGQLSWRDPISGPYKMSPAGVVSFAGDMTNGAPAALQSHLKIGRPRLNSSPPEYLPRAHLNLIDGLVLIAKRVDDEVSHTDIVECLELAPAFIE